MYELHTWLTTSLAALQLLVIFIAAVKIIQKQNHEWQERREWWVERENRLQNVERAVSQFGADSKDLAKAMVKLTEIDSEIRRIRDRLDIFFDGQPRKHAPAAA